MGNNAAGSLCLSIDLELAWGWWDRLSPDVLRHAETEERPIVARLLALADRYEIPMTWAAVGRIFDEKAKFDGLPGPRSAWYAPEIIEAIQAARAKHEIGSHSWSHAYFGEVSRAAAAEEIERDLELRRRWGVPMRSWVYPRNDIGHVDLLAPAGVRVYRTREAGLLDVVRRRLPRAHAAANLLVKMLPVVPPVVAPGPPDERLAGIVALPSSTLLLRRDGVRRLVRPGMTIWRWKRALDQAARAGRVFHPWFHPSNFFSDAAAQFSVLEAVFRHAARLRDSGDIAIRTMAEFGAAPG